MNEQYEFFWSGPFSQWYPCTFKADSGNVVGDRDFGSLTFNCAEQYMMFKKAQLFGDEISAEEIMRTNQPHEQKALGRKVKGFNVEIWNSKAKEIVYAGNYKKFTQDERLKNILMSTGTKTLVEASPYDTIWGIGLNEKDAKKTPQSMWKGSNWLGEVLTQLRDDLRQV